MAGRVVRLVVIESPYAGDVEANVAYARRAVADSLARGEAPIASHLLYTQPGILDDLNPLERAQGISAGLAWSCKADFAAFYVDRGWSRGMVDAYRFHRDAGRVVVVRELDQVTDAERRRRNAGRTDWRDSEWQDHCGDRACEDCHGIGPLGPNPTAPHDAPEAERAA